jgi:hypothetical protein
VAAGPGLARLELPGAAGLARTLRELPAAPGVAQLLGEGDLSLLIARPGDLRRWARSQLGLGPSRRGRPATDLSGVARALRFVETVSGFEQRLRCERLMAEHVEPGARRDLPQPFWLGMDARERFPRLVVASSPPPHGAWGPFRGRDAAREARDRLNRLLGLRPCEEDFEPAADLPLGLGCLYAQVRSCAAPCLERSSAEAYRELAREAAALLGAPEGRAPETRAWLPESVAAHDARAVAAEPLPGGRLGLWPVRGGRVGEGVTAGSAGEGLAALSWPDPALPPSDAAWLLAWLGERRRRGAYLVLAPQQPPELAAAALERVVT